MNAADASAAWTFAAFLVTVFGVLDAVIQSFFLHSALAKGKVHAPELAGVRLLMLWLPAIAIWLAAGIAAGVLRTPERCTPADGSMVFLGLFYPLTIWPAWWLARRARVRLAYGYWIAQAFPAVSFLLFGGFPCF